MRKVACFASIFAMFGFPAVGSLQTIAPREREVDRARIESADAAFRLGVENKKQVLVARRHFSEATDLYRALHQEGVRSSALYLNLGNAATLADRWPEAIWAYHIGLRLDPNDAGLRDHLAFVRGKVIYPPAGQGRTEPDTWPVWLHRPTIVEYYWTSAVSYLIACLAGTCVLVRRWFGLMFLAIAAMVVALLAGGGARHLEQEAERDQSTPLVVIAQNTPFHRGNASSYPQHAVLPILPRGMEVRQQYRRGNWLQVHLTTGEVGWIPVSAALIVEP